MRDPIADGIARHPPMPALARESGTLRGAALQYGTALADWIDLSAPINPHPYPIPPLAPTCWHQLPDDSDGLEAAAARYYGNDRLLVVAGAHAALRALPALFRPAVVACLTPIADAHTAAWKRAGHLLRRLPTLARVLAAATPYVLLANPNPASGSVLGKAALVDAAAQLERRGGWLLVDETLADADPENAVAALAGGEAAPNLIVIRSLAPFFGLPGARVGFVFGAGDKLDRLREMLGPWPVATPSRALARQALADSAWQAAAGKALASDARTLAELLAPLGEVHAAALFCSIKISRVDTLFEHLAARAILTRRFPEGGLLRIALPRDTADWQRLSAAVLQWKSPS